MQISRSRHERKTIGLFSLGNVSMLSILLCAILSIGSTQISPSNNLFTPPLVLNQFRSTADEPWIGFRDPHHDDNYIWFGGTKIPNNDTNWAEGNIFIRQRLSHSRISVGLESSNKTQVELMDTFDSY